MDCSICYTWYGFVRTYSSNDVISLYIRTSRVTKKKKKQERKKRKKKCHEKCCTRRCGLLWTAAAAAVEDPAVLMWKHAASCGGVSIPTGNAMLVSQSAPLFFFFFFVASKITEQYWNPYELLLIPRKTWSKKKTIRIYTSKSSPLGQYTGAV